MKWKIETFNCATKAQFIDGQAIVNHLREGNNKTSRLATPKGFLDILTSTNGLYLNGILLKANESAQILTLKLSISTDGIFTAATTGINISGNLKPQPIIDNQFLNAFREMINIKLVPYAYFPDEPSKTVEEIEALGQQYFPFRDDSFLLAMAIYDWTTADFDRTVLFSQYSYTALEDRPLDLQGITDAIWTSNWPPYTPQDKYFMGSYLMNPASTREEVYNQLIGIASLLNKYAKAETRIIAAALSCMPPTPTAEKPQLFSGQVDIANLGSDHFAPGFFEFINNANLDAPLKMGLKEALASFMQKGNVITSKKIISFTDSVEDAMHYQNGILLIAEPENEDLTWANTTYITPLSDGPKKTEYAFQAGSKFLVKDIDYKIIDDKKMVIITLQTKGCLNPDLVAGNNSIPINSKLSEEKQDTKNIPNIKNEKSYVSSLSIFNKITSASLIKKQTEEITEDDFVLINLDPNDKDLIKENNISRCTIS